MFINYVMTFLLQWNYLIYIFTNLFHDMTPRNDITFLKNNFALCEPIKFEDDFAMTFHMM